MIYPVGTRVWLNILQGASINGGEVLWRAVVASKPNRKGWFDTDLLLGHGPHRYVAVPSDVAAALIPGPTTDPNPLRRQLERYAKREEDRAERCFYDQMAKRVKKIGDSFDAIALSLSSVSKKEEK